MMFNSIEKQLQRFNNQRKYNCFIDDNKKVKIFYPPTRQQIYQTKSKLSQINQQLQQKTQTILYYQRHPRKSSQSSSEYSDLTVSRKRNSQPIIQTLSPLQFNKYLNRTSQIYQKREPQLQNKPIQTINESPYYKIQESRSQRAVSFAHHTPFEQSVDKEKKDMQKYSNIKSIGEKQRQQEQFYQIEKPVKINKSSPIQKIIQKGQMLSYLLIVIGVILMIVQIIK